MPKQIAKTGGTSTARKTSPKNVVVETKKHDEMDLIPCISVTAGELFFVGARSKELYTWANADYITEVQYRDLKYAVMSRDKQVFKPRFVIQDEMFLEEFPELKDIYGPLYSTKDLMEILKQPPAKIKESVEALPEGVKETMKSVVSQMIDDDALDSVQKVRAVDECLGTEMVLKLSEK